MSDWRYAAEVGNNRQQICDIDGFANDCAKTTITSRRKRRAWINFAGTICVSVLEGGSGHK